MFGIVWSLWYHNASKSPDFIGRQLAFGGNAPIFRQIQNLAVRVKPCSVVQAARLGTRGCATNFSTSADASVAPDSE